MVGGALALVDKCTDSGSTQRVASTPDSAPPPASTPTPEEQAHTAAVNTAAMAVELIRRNLRNPDSFVLEDVTLQDSGALCITYRGQNGFGGMNREHAVLHDQSKTFEIEGQPGFDAAWRRRCENKQGEDVTEEVKDRAEVAKAIVPKMNPPP